jgi:EmrB/QacA subfamily drug resistance transporter
MAEAGAEIGGGATGADDIHDTRVGPATGPAASWAGTSAADRRRLRRVVIAAAIAQAAVNLDFFAMGIALPSMAVDLGSTVTDLQWVVSGYLVALGAFLVAGGRLGDLYGRRRWLIGGMVLFAGASAVAGACSTPTRVIAFRILQGVGAAVVFPGSLAVVTNAFPPDRVQRAVGTVFGIAVAGTALGPFVGGFLTQALSWRYVFWLNIPIAVVVVALVATSVAESHDADAPRHLDVAGLLLIVAGVATITLAFDQASPWGWTSPATLGLLAAGVALLVGFVFVELHSDHPLLDLGLFRSRVFDSMIVAGTIGNAVYNVVIFSATIYLQQVRSLSPVEAGVVFLALSLGASVAGQVSGRVEQHPSWLVMAVALTAGAAGTLGLALSDQYAVYVPMFALTGFGLGLGWAYTSVATQAIVPPAKAGAASGVVLTVLIGVGGIAITVAASFLETRGGAGLEPAIDDLLRVGAVVALAGAVVAILTGRARTTA